MELKLYRLRDQEAEQFTWLDPYGYLKRLGEPDHFALVAAMEGTEPTTGATEEVPAGLAVARAGEEELTLLWLCVNPEQRGRGIGERLIGELRSIGEQAGLFVLTAEMPDLGAEHEESAKAAREYLAYHGL